MIKPVNIFSLTIIILSALGLFKIKHYVQNLNKDYSEIAKYVDQEKEAIHVLKAEWTYLNQPERLRKIISNYLELDTIRIDQIHKLINNLPIELAENKDNLVNQENSADNFAKNIMNPEPSTKEKYKFVKDKVLSTDKKTKYKFSNVKF